MAVAEPQPSSFAFLAKSRGESLSLTAFLPGEEEGEDWSFLLALVSWSVLVSDRTDWAGCAPHVSFL